MTDTAPVSAQDPDDPSIPEDSSSSAGYGASGANPSHDLMASSSASEDDPADCLLAAHHVHNSRHYDRPGDDRMSGEVRATCAYRVNEIWHYAQLQESRWPFRWVNVDVT